MESDCGVTGSIIDETCSSEIQGDQMEGENGVTSSIIDELHSLDIQRDQMESEGCVSRSIIDELHYSDLVKWKVKVVLLEVSLMNLILLISKGSKGR